MTKEKMVSYLESMIQELKSTNDQTNPAVALLMSAQIDQYDGHIDIFTDDGFGNGVWIGAVPISATDTVWKGTTPITARANIFTRLEAVFAALWTPHEVN